MPEARSHQAAGPEVEPEAPVGAAPVAAPVTQAEHVVSMQRGAGNAAVSRLLAARPAVARLTGSPGDLTNPAGAATTTHAAPTLDDAANHTGTPAASGGASLAQPMMVRPKATQSTPFVGDTATEADLYEVDATGVSQQNPHHTNAPDTTGASPSATGVFTLPLASFFMLYGSVMSNELTIPAY
jgi:hypothetical protein